MGGDHTLLVTAEQGEDAVNEIYSKAMETYLPTAIREILTAQAAHIQLTYAFVKRRVTAPKPRANRRGMNKVRSEGEVLC